MHFLTLSREVAPAKRGKMQQFHSLAKTKEEILCIRLFSNKVRSCFENAKQLTESCNRVWALITCRYSSVAFIYILSTTNYHTTKIHFIINFNHSVLTKQLNTVAKLTLLMLRRSVDQCSAF